MLLIRPVLQTNRQRTRRHAHRRLLHLPGRERRRAPDPARRPAALPRLPRRASRSPGPSGSCRTGSSPWPSCCSRTSSGTRCAYGREPAQAVVRDDAQRDAAPARRARSTSCGSRASCSAVAFLHAPWREALILALTGLSLWQTPRAVHRANEFTPHPMIEVAVLFLGIFLTMIPALELLRTAGRRARRAGALAVLLGDRRAVLVPRQRADLPHLPRPGPGAPPGRRGRRACPTRSWPRSASAPCSWARTPTSATPRTSWSRRSPRLPGCGCRPSSATCSTARAILLPVFAVVTWLFFSGPRAIRADPEPAGGPGYGTGGREPSSGPRGTGYAPELPRARSRRPRVCRPVARPRTGTGATRASASIFTSPAHPALLPLAPPSSATWARRTRPRRRRWRPRAPHPLGERDPSRPTEERELPEARRGVRMVAEAPQAPGAGGIADRDGGRRTRRRRDWRRFGASRGTRDDREGRRERTRQDRLDPLGRGIQPLDRGAKTLPSKIETHSRRCSQQHSESDPERDDSPAPAGAGCSQHGPRGRDGRARWDNLRAGNRRHRRHGSRGRRLRRPRRHPHRRRSGRCGKHETGLPPVRPRAPACGAAPLDGSRMVLRASLAHPATIEDDAQQVRTDPRQLAERRERRALTLFHDEQIRRLERGGGPRSRLGLAWVEFSCCACRDSLTAAWTCGGSRASAREPVRPSGAAPLRLRSGPFTRSPCRRSAESENHTAGGLNPPLEARANSRERQSCKPPL